MATNDNKAEKQCSKEITNILAELNTGKRFSRSALKKMQDDVKKMDAREVLDVLLQDININLGIIKQCKTKMNAGYSSTYTARDYMVRAGRKVLTLLGQRFYSRGYTQVEKGEFVSQYDGMHLSAEIDNYFEGLSEMRDFIVSCTRLHAELYVMGQQLDEFDNNIEILKLKIPNLPEDKSNTEKRTISHSLYQNLISLSGLAFALCVLVRIFADLFADMWNIQSNRRKVFKEIYQSRKELETACVKYSYTQFSRNLGQLKRN